jgi:hypothetical protein
MKWSRRHWFVAVMAVFVFGAGLAQAAHFHKPTSGSRGDVHLQCQLCAHAERAAPPPAAHRPLLFQVVWSAVVVPPDGAAHATGSTSFFRARAPPV